MNVWHSHLNLGFTTLETWTLLGRLPAALLVVGFLLHARRAVRTAYAAAAASGLVAGLVIGTALLPSIVGALAGGIVGWGLSLWIMNIRLPWAFVATRWMLAVVGIGRIGCLMAGCCFGAPTDLPWGVVYPPGSFAHKLHSQIGWVDSASNSLPVHPTALYESVLLLSGALLLPLLRRRIRSDRALALMAAAAYLLWRAAIDPLRGMLNTRSSVPELGPLSHAQWGFLAAALGLAAAAIFLRRPRRSDDLRPGTDVPSLVRAAVLFVGNAAAVALAHAELTAFLAVLSLWTLGIAGILLIREAALAASPLSRRTGAVAATGLLLMIPAGLRAAGGDNPGRFWVYAVEPAHGRLVRIGNQATPETLLAQAEAELDSNGEAPPPMPPPPRAAQPVPQTPPDEAFKVLPEASEFDETPAPWAPKSLRVETPVPDKWPQGRNIVIYGGGGYLERHEHDHIVEGDTSCGGTATVRDYDYQHQHAPFSGGVAFGRDGKSSPDGNSSWQVRLGLAGEQWSRSGNDGDPTAGVDVMGVVGGMYEFEFPKVGVGIGGAVGLGQMNGPDPIGIPLGKIGFFMPGFHLRLGPQDGFGFEFGTGARDQFDNAAFAGFRWSILGSEFRMGAETARFESVVLTIYADARIHVADHHALLLRLDVPQQVGLPGTASGSTITTTGATGTLGWAIFF